MNVRLNPKQEALIKQKIEAGLYGSFEEVIDQALRLLEEHDRDLEELRAEVQLGLDQLERGDYTEYTDETLHELFDRVKQRGRERRASRKPARPE